MHELGVRKFYIELIEEFPCEHIEQLQREEGKDTREFGTLNHTVSGRTIQESKAVHIASHK